jgi:hypothetical protein
MAVIEAIATVILENDASSIEFTSIPSTYQHLELHITNRGDGGTPMEHTLLRFGTGGGAVDTGSNYVNHYIKIKSNDTVPRPAAYTANYGISTTYTPSGGNWTGEPCFGFVRMTIMDYAHTSKITTTEIMCGAVFGGKYHYATDVSAIGFNNHGLWNNTGAVDRIWFQTSSGDVKRGTTASLYGLKSS